MKVFMNRKPVEGPWGGGNLFVSAMYKYAPQFGVEFVERPIAANVIFVAGLDMGNTGVSADDTISYRHLSSGNIKIISRINENDARKGTVGVDASLVRLMRNSDGVIFVSNWLKNYFPPPPVVTTKITGGIYPWFGFALDDPRKFDSFPVIVNGVDSNVFRPRLNLRIYDRINLRIVAHHWSNHEKKGFDFYEFLDEYCDKNLGYKFHYIGRTRQTFRGKNTIITSPCFGSELGKTLSEHLERHNIYVSASRFDPGPNHILESIACGLDTYVHVDGGGAVEFAGRDHVYSTTDELESILKSHSMGKKNPNSLQLNSWEECIKSYVEYMKGVVEK